MQNFEHLFEKLPYVNQNKVSHLAKNVTLTKNAPECNCTVLRDFVRDWVNLNKMYVVMGEVNTFYSVSSSGPGDCLNQGSIISNSSSNQGTMMELTNINNNVKHPFLSVR